MFKNIIICNFILCLTWFTTLSVAQTYVNMIPYKSPSCTGEQTGIGYSWIVDTCIGFRDNNFYFDIRSDGNVTMSEYSRSVDCGSNNPNTQKTFYVDYCYATDYAGTEQYPQNNYVKIQVVNNPPPPPQYGLKYSVFEPTDNECSGNVQMYYYYVNNTVWQDQFDHYQFFCSATDNLPYETVCAVSDNDDDNKNENDDDDEVNDSSSCFTSTWWSACGISFYLDYKSYTMTSC
ncbi:hypothetical protein PPL_02207 [Heterostelium album PN500]|uniref:Uncharacterized protein n=1 Tax=Heterostelium pallidum (strain ATCC 26659 / Pp 5 / PN500) TaxID=670386 RepID=D3B1N3_HETP5|nr:hypothetical protein PPL_02207 [Heterostelium album PN500]EFA85207.1 hypothetical protein PPL_02207 [Heterostelium album PN500]|eukprot:XP_020437316.1 hypothetical protein PPL_02207 [Heterostelium album PN500]